MTRGNGELTKVIYKSSNETFHAMIESPEALNNWKKDPSIPLTEVVNSFHVFVTHGQGVQGRMNTASNQVLDTEFGTHDEDSVIKKILMEGQVQGRVMPERHGGQDIRDGPMGTGPRGAHN